MQHRLWPLAFLVLTSACGNGSSGSSADDLGPCPVEVSDLALYQTLKVPLITAGQAIATRKVDIVERKSALVRGFLGPSATVPLTGPVAITARLTVTTAAGTAAYMDEKTIDVASTEETLDSTVNFAVDGDHVKADAKLALDIVSPASCSQKAEARLPRSGTYPLAPRATGLLKVVLVPVEYDTDGSKRLPDTSDSEIDRLRKTMLALYPVADVSLTLREPVILDQSLVGGSGTDWANFLDTLRSLRAFDKAADDVYYYGIVQPAATLASYCKGACIAGISFQVTGESPALRVGVGVLYPGDTSALTLAHEVGHGHGRGHAPCGATAGLDPAYPYDGGVTSSWGFDLRTAVLIPPTRKDLMGYCDPQWISDYNYQALLERSTSVNPPLAFQIGTPTPADYQVLIVGPDGLAHAGSPLKNFALPLDTVSESAAMLGGSGEDLGSVDVHHLPLADVDDVKMVLVPSMPAAARAFRLPSRSDTIRLDLTTPALRFRQ